MPLRGSLSLFLSDGGQIRAHVQASKEVLGKTEQDNWLMVLPLFHVSGLSILMRSLYNGTAVTILPKYDEAQVLKLIESENINMMSLVPTILTQLGAKITIISCVLSCSVVSSFLWHSSMLVKRNLYQSIRPMA